VKHIKVYWLKQAFSKNSGTGINIIDKPGILIYRN
jgi:hypothetical protein